MREENTYRFAAGYNYELHKYLKANVANYKADKWSIVSGSSNPFTVPNTNGQKDSIISAFETNAWTSANWATGWGFTKHANNPLVAKPYGTNYYEYYPSCITLDGNTYRCMGKNNNQGWGYSSSDGIAWTENGVYLTRGNSGQWDDENVAIGVHVKDSEGFHLIYSGYGDIPVYNHKIGYAFATSWGAFTKNANPVWTAADYNAINGTSWNGIMCSKVVKVGNRYYYFGLVFNNDFLTSDFVFGIGEENAHISAVKLDTKIMSCNVLDPMYNWGQSPSAFKHPVTGEWILTLTIGRLIQDSSVDNQALYAVFSGRTDAPIFTEAGFRGKPILFPDVTKNYENNYNYAANWLTDLEGILISVNSKGRLYFSGHQNSTAFQYTGVMCLAEININSIPSSIT